MLGLAAVIVASFFIGVSFGIGYPAAAFQLTKAGEADWVVGLIGAAPSLGVLVALPFVPKIVRRFGAVATLAAGGAGAAVCYGVLAAVDSTAAWLLIRLVMGGAIAVSWLVSQTWMSCASDEVSRGRALALYVMAFSSGMAVCPGLMDMLGVSGPLPLVAGAVASILSIIPFVLVARLAPSADTSDTGAGNVLKALSWVPVAMVGAFLAGFIELTHLSLLPTAGLASGLDQSAVLLLLTLFLVGALTLQFAFGWLADKLPTVQLTITLAIILSAVCLLIPAALPVPLFGPIVIFAVGGLIYGLYTVALAIVGELKNSADTGPANAAFIMCYQAGGIAGPIIAGAVMSVDSMTGFVGIQVAACLLTAAIMIAAAKWLPQRT